jgi:hypothetical protein
MELENTASYAFRHGHSELVRWAQEHGMPLVGEQVVSEFQDQSDEYTDEEDAFDDEDDDFDEEGEEDESEEEGWAGSLGDYEDEFEEEDEDEDEEADAEEDLESEIADNHSEPQAVEVAAMYQEAVAAAEEAMAAAII